MMKRPAEITPVNRFNFRKLCPLLRRDEIQYIDALLDSRTFFAACAHTDGQYVGVITLAPAIYEGTVESNVFRVLPSYRRRGIGTMLLAFVSNWAIQGAYKNFWAFYLDKEIDACSFFRRYPGKERIQRIEVCFRNGIDIQKLYAALPFWRGKEITSWHICRLQECSEKLSDTEVQAYKQRESSLYRENIFDQNDIFFPPLCTSDSEIRYSFAVEHNGRLAGWIVAGEKDDSSIFINRLYIEPEYRGSSLFFALVKTVLDHAIVEGKRVEWIVLHWSASFFKICQKRFRELGFSDLSVVYSKDCLLSDFIIK